MVITVQKFVAEAKDPGTEVPTTDQIAKLSLSDYLITQLLLYQSLLLAYHKVVQIQRINITLSKRVQSISWRSDNRLTT